MFRLKLSLLAKFSLVAFVITAAIAVALAWGLQRHLEKSLLMQEAEDDADQVASIINPQLKPSDLMAPLSSQRFEEIDRYLREHVLRQHIVRINIYNREGLMLYTDKKDLVGRHFPLNQELHQALAGKVAMDVSSLQKEENIGERQRFTRLIEIYIPLRPGNSTEVLGAYEVYHDLSVLDPHIARLRRLVWISVGLGFLILYGSLFMLVRNASRELVERNRENARLYEEAENRLSRLQALFNIDQAITGSLDLRLTLNVVLSEITAQLRVDAAAVLLLKSAGQTLEYAAGRGFHTKGIEASRLRVGEGYAGRAALEHRRLSVSNLSAAAGEFLRLPLLAPEKFVSYFAMPLIAKGQVKGVLEIFHRALLEPDEEWLGFLEALATQTAIAVDNITLFEELQRSNMELSLAYDATIESWSRIMDLRDKQTEGHSQRVTALTLRLAEIMGISEAERLHIRRGALLHDIGKMGVPDGILLKEGPLNEAEWEIMRRHTIYAYEMLSPIAFLRPALDIPYYHHERWDGAGYPRRLKGEQIPLSARIFAVVDVWDALLSARPYRPAWPKEKVREYLKSLSGSHFDPKVVEVFLGIEK